MKEPKSVKNLPCDCYGQGGEGSYIISAAEMEGDELLKPKTRRKASEKVHMEFFLPQKWQSDHERQTPKLSFFFLGAGEGGLYMSVTSGRCLIDAPLLHLDRNCAITRAHRFLLAHKSGRSQDKECDTEKQQAGRREVLRTPSLIAAKVPEEEWVGGSRWKVD